MKKIGLVVFMVCVVLAGCKTTKRHVQRSSLDSVSESRGSSNSDLVAISTRARLTNLQLDSAWATALRLKNFSGTILPNGKIEGTADEAEVNQAGTMSKDEGTRYASNDSIAEGHREENYNLEELEKKEYDRQKEVEGVGMPWYVWLIIVGAIAFLLYGVYNRIKSKLKPF